MLKVNPRKKNNITYIRREKDALILKSESGTLALIPQTENTVRVIFTKEDNVSFKTGIGIEKKESFSDWEYTENNEDIALIMPKLKVKISKESGTIKYFDSFGKLLLAEREQDSHELEAFTAYKYVINENTKTEETETPDGVKRVIKEADRVEYKTLYHTRTHYTFKDNEKLFGLGQAEEGALNLRGTTQYVHQANLKIAIPLLVSTEGYGILLAGGSPAIFSDTQYGSYIYTEADEKSDFYFIAAENIDGVISGYRQLTGKASMLPRWAFGFLQSQERYETQNEILGIAEEFKKREIGVDCIILDWCSWRGEEWGQKSFDKERFPDVKAMTDKLHEDKIRFMLSVWPNMAAGTENYNEFYDKKLLLPASEIYDAFNPKARELYWKQAKDGAYKYGVDAWWCDSSEPFTPEWSRPIKPEPSAMYSEFVETASKYLAPENMNAYGLVHAKALYDGQRGENDGKRVVNLTRSTHTGGQKYGTILWSGDTYASWETLRKQIVAGLNFCASGLPYWTLDIGAFFVKKGVQWFWNGEYDSGLDDMGYRELFVRWFQYGAFLPVFRSHGTDVRREMWGFGEKGDMFYDALVTANRLRYRLIPYIYSLAGNAWLNDNTLMRMLAFDFAGDERALSVKDEYMFGDAFLVCPVTEPMYFEKNSTPIERKKTRLVYLPSGVDWFDFYTDKKYSGGQTIEIDADISKIPLFVRAGSIVPMTKALQNTDEMKDAEIEFHVYSGADAVLKYYDDAGDGYGYENGEYSVTEISWNGRELKVPESFERKYSVIIHN